MASCKFKVSKGRFARDCSSPANHAITFTNAIADEYLITVQLPLCDDHYEDKVAQLNALGQSFDHKKL